MRNRYDSLGRIKQYQGPVLQSHGTADELVRIEHAKRLFAAVPGEKKQFVELDGANHNSPLPRHYFEKLRQFLAEM